MKNSEPAEDIPDDVTHHAHVTHNPEHTQDVDMDWPDDTDYPNIPNRTKTQQDYLLEFVKRVDPFLTALLTREIPARVECSQCAEHSIARWRCRDCTSATMLCRRCMRVTHFENPLHRIEAWTGTYFRRAELWQVGLYIVVPHHTGEQLCDWLKWNQTLLNGFPSGKTSFEYFAPPTEKLPENSTKLHQLCTKLHHLCTNIHNCTFWIKWIKWCNNGFSERLVEFRLEKWCTIIHYFCIILHHFALCLTQLVQMIYTILFTLNVKPH
jgi:hypothetical protein